MRLGFEPAEPESVERFDDGQGPYLYYPAVSHPHKNHETLFRSIAALTGKPNIPGRILLSGQKTANWKRLENILNQTIVLAHAKMAVIIRHDTGRILSAMLKND